MTKEQERVLAQIEANDPHPERGEIKFGTDRVLGDYYERESFKNNLDGVGERMYERWYPNGQLSERSTYKRGRYDGLYERWHLSGALAEKYNYKDGELNGLFEKYQDLSFRQLTERGSYKNDQLDGLYERWSSKGTLQERCVYQAGEVVRSLPLYDEIEATGALGKTLAQIEANDPYPERGKIKCVNDANGTYFYRESSDGFCEYWDDFSGNLMRRYQVNERGDKDGVLEEYRQDGGLEKRTSYKNGRRDGVSERWYPNGQLEWRGSYKSDKLDGLCEHWYPSGQLEWRCAYKDARLNGLREEWYENGQLNQRCTNKDGLRDGLYESWSLLGRLERKCMYKYGRICEPQPQIIVPSSPVQEQAQAILNARGECNDNTLKTAQEEQVERKSQSHKL